MTDQPLALSLDIGTSSTRVLLWDTAGREIEGCKAQVQYHMRTTPDGGAEMPAEELLAHVGEALDQALTQENGRRLQPHIVGVSTFWHALLGLDDSGQPITPIFNWADTRAADEARRLRSEWDERAIHARTGCMLHPSYYPAKLSWLRKTQPALFDRVSHWVSPGEYLFGRWFGPQARLASISMASATGIFSQEQRSWDTEILAALQVPAEKLSPLVDLKQPSQGLTPEFATRWPALRDVPFYPAVGDGACGNIGSGCTSPERLAINLGTSGALRAVWDESASPQAAASIPEGLWRYRVDGRRPIMGAAFSDGGNAHAWITSVLKFATTEAIEQEIAARDPGEHGLLFLPFLAGERSMGWHPDARAALVGLTLDHGPVDILRAVMEAVALRFTLAVQIVRGVFPQAREIIASGGAIAHSPAWTQIFADALGTPVTTALEPEASSRGAAILAMEAAGLIQRAEETQARLGQTFTPDAGRHQRYAAMLSAQEELYGQLIGRP